MAKIGVYVPEERMKDIEVWREKLNFSQLFMEAFDRAITAQAQLSTVKGKEMKSLIDRLKKEASGITENGWKAGAKEGREWAIKYAYISHLRKIGEGSLKFTLENTATNFLYAYYECKGYAKSPEEEYSEHQEERYCDMETFRNAFNQGFSEAVQHVWDEIKDAFKPTE